MTPAALIARLALPLIVLGLTGCAGGHPATTARASSSGSSTSAATMSASAVPTDSSAGEFADPDPSSDHLTGAAEGCALVAEMVGQIRAGHLPEAQATLPHLIAIAFELRNDPSSAALVRDVQQAVPTLSDPTVLERDWAQSRDVAKLPAIPQLMAGCHQ